MRRDRSVHVPKQMASLLFSCGSDPNEAVADKQDGMLTTPWVAWLKATSRPALCDTDLLEAADIALMFLNAGADLVGDLQFWLTRHFHQFRRSPRVRAKEAELLRLIKRLGGDCLASDIDDSDLAIDGDHDNTDFSLTSPLKMFQR